MKLTQFDTLTKSQFTAEVVGPSFDQKITGRGYFIIVNPNSKYVSFSKNHTDICFGDIASDIIPNYTNQQYAEDYGDRQIGTGNTVREYMQQNCGMNIQ